MKRAILIALMLVGGARAQMFAQRFGQSWTPLTLGPVAWYRGDGNALDSSGNGYNGTWSGTESYTNGVNAHAFWFDGASSVNSGNITTVTNMTVAAWVNPIGSNEDGYIFAFGSPVAKNINVQWNGGVDRLLVYVPSGYIQSDAVFSEFGQFVHIAVVFEGTNILFYKNGAAAGAATRADLPTIGAMPIYIGNRQGGSSAATFWNGAIDGAVVYPTAPTPAEITQLYNWRQ